jgi:hypothetical protein
MGFIFKFIGEVILKINIVYFLHEFFKYYLKYERQICMGVIPIVIRWVVS